MPRKEPFDKQQRFDFLNAGDSDIPPFGIIDPIGTQQTGERDFLRCGKPTLSGVQHWSMVNEGRTISQDKTGTCVAGYYPTLVAHDSSVSPKAGESWACEPGGYKLRYRGGGFRVLGTIPDAPDNTVLAMKEPWQTLRGTLLQDFHTLGYAPTAGTATLTYQGTSVTINYDDDLTEFTTAMGTLFGDSDNVEVTDSSGRFNGLSYNVELKGDLLNKNVEAVIADGTGLTDASCYVFITQHGRKEVKYTDQKGDRQTIAGQNTIQQVVVRGGSARVAVSYWDLTNAKWQDSGMRLNIVTPMQIGGALAEDDVILAEYEPTLDRFILNASGGCEP